MKTYSALCAWCWLAVLALAIPSDEDRPKVLVLVNETTLAGMIERDGDEYRIKNGTGETAVPATRVLRVCNGLEDAYQYLLTRSNPRDADERVRLARWCLQNNLLQKAREETEEALRLRPGHADAKRTLKNIEAKERENDAGREGGAGSPPASASLEEGTAGLSARVGGTGSLPASGTGGQTARATQDALASDYTAETMQTFVRRIQPVLVNGCGAGNCHGNVKNGGFELNRPPSGGSVSAAVSRQNLIATLALLNRDFPEQSPLLTKATERHGGGPKPPLGRDSAAYAALEAWVKKALPDQPRDGLGSAEPALKTNAAPTEARPAYSNVSQVKPGEPSTPEAGDVPNSSPLHELQVKAGRFTPGPADGNRATSPGSTSAPDSIHRNGIPFVAGKPLDPKKEPAGARLERKTFVTPGEFTQRFVDRGEALTGPDAKPKAEPEPTPADPFDPLIFNRLVHGAGGTPGKERKPPGLGTTPRERSTAGEQSPPGRAKD